MEHTYTFEKIVWSSGYSGPVTPSVANRWELGIEEALRCIDILEARIAALEASGVTPSTPIVAGTAVFGSAVFGSAVFN